MVTELKINRQWSKNRRGEQSRHRASVTSIAYLCFQMPRKLRRWKITMIAGCGKNSGTRSKCRSLCLKMTSNWTRIQMKRIDLKSSGALTFKIILVSRTPVEYTNQARVLQELGPQKSRWRVPKILWHRLRSDLIKKNSSKNTRMCRLKQFGLILAK